MKLFKTNFKKLKIRHAFSEVFFRNYPKEGLRHEQRVFETLKRQKTRKKIIP